MRDFTKERICQYLAEMELPMTPAFELRKLSTSDTAKPESYRHILDMYYRLTLNLFDPPKPYLAYPLPFYVGDVSIERLSDDDYHLLYDIADIKSLDVLLESTDKFKDYCKLFTESEKKPDWDLVRVLVNDTLSNYLERQKNYESLLSGGLTTQINSGEVIKLDENVYRLPKRFTIEKFDKNNRKGLITYCFSACFYKTVGDDLSEYWCSLNKGKVSELEKIQYASQINDILSDALTRNELPVHRRPTFCIVKFTGFPANPDTDVIFWHEIKAVLEERTGQGVPEDPRVFTERDKPEGNALKDNGADRITADETPTINLSGTAYSRRKTHFKELVEQGIIKLDYSMTDDEIYSKVIETKNAAWSNQRASSKKNISESVINQESFEREFFSKYLAEIEQPRKRGRPVTKK